MADSTRSANPRQCRTTGGGAQDFIGGTKTIWGRRAKRRRQERLRDGIGSGGNRNSCSGTASRERPSEANVRKRLCHGTWQGADFHSLDTREDGNWKKHTSSVIHLTSGGGYKTSANCERCHVPQASRLRLEWRCGRRRYQIQVVRSARSGSPPSVLRRANNR